MSDFPPTWRTYLTPEETTNDSDKAFVTPVDVEREIAWVWVELTTTVVVGNRLMCLQVLDEAGDLIFEALATPVQAASLTRYYLFAEHVPQAAAFVNVDYASITIPRMPLLPGWSVRVFDRAAVDAAADDMVVQYVYRARSV